MAELLKNTRFFMDSDVHSWLFNGFDQVKELRHRSGTVFTMDITDQPFSCTAEHTEDAIVIKLYIRSELGAFVESPDLAIRITVSDMSSHVIANTGRLGGNAGQTVVAFLEAASMFLYYLEQEGLCQEFAELEETAGIMVSREADTLHFEKVTGKARPDMACTTLFGGIQQMRPYQDEIMDSWMDELLPFEEKLAAAEAGDEAMMEQVAIAYLNGEDVEPDPEKATGWFRRLAELGHSDAQFNMGLHCAKGHGVKRSFTEALFWMEKAAENGDEDAPAIVERLQKAVAAEAIIDTGDAQAEADLAGFYMFLGNSLNQADPSADYEIALQFAESSAVKGNGDGIWALALAYEHGRGVSENVERAIELYKKGAELGHAPSQHSYACYLFRGDILEEDHDTAFRLCLASAEQGYGLAIRDVGRCYQFGNGVEENMPEAIRWYEKALAVMPDEELARKVAVFKELESHGAFADVPEADEEDET